MTLRTEQQPHEQQSIVLRLWINLIGGGMLSVGLFYFWLYPSQYQIAALIQAAAAVLVGMASLIRGLRGLFNARVEQNTDQIVAIAVLASAAQGDFITAVSVPLLLDLVRIFEERTVLGAREAIASLLALSRPPVIRIQEEREETCSTEELKIGDILLVRPGMRIGADATVIQGWSLIDTAAISGEAIPQEVSEGSNVFAGSQNISAEIRIQVTALHDDSILGRVILLLEEAMQGAKTQVLEKWIGVYVPVALCAAATVLFFTEDLDRSIAVLIALCPIALVIAGPSTMVCALSAAARLGALIKSRDALALLHRCRVLAIDKTGTLTDGQFAVIKMTGDDAVLRLAASCAQVSLHPLSQALISYAHTKELSLFPISGEELRGKGVKVLHEGRCFRLGRASWLREEGVLFDEPPGTQGSAVFFAEDNRLIGCFFFVDTIREHAKDILTELRDMGVKDICMLTGDHESEALRVANTLGITEFYAGLLPEDKSLFIQKKKDDVLMIGDGINDALALHTATVGIAVGRDLSQAVLGGADIAIENEGLKQIPALIRLSKYAEDILTRNIALAVCGGIILAIFSGLGIFSVLWVAGMQFVVAILVSIQSALLLGTED